MLPGVLYTEIVINISILIINAFVSMKNYLSNSLLEQNFYKNMLLYHDDRIKILEIKPDAIPLTLDNGLRKSLLLF